MNKTYYFKTSDLSVGYNHKVLIKDINISLERGQILTLIGPNGGGKSTILKSITKYLSLINGVVYLDNESLDKMSNKDLSKKLSVVLTERIRPEMMSCFDVVATGRYPYTNSFGLLTDDDKKIVYETMEMVHALDLVDKDFLEISDGQRQRIMLARAIAQEPEIIVLDEPTSFLDIKHKIELLAILHKMAKEKNIAVIMSLHEIDLAPKISDLVMCVKGDTIYKFGTPEEIFTSEIISDLYGIQEGSYNSIYGSVELPKVEGIAKIFVIAGNGKGSKIYRELQKRDLAFYTGILYENDIDYLLAKDLAVKVISIPAFEKIKDENLNSAFQLIDECDIIIDSKCEIKELDSFQQDLLSYSKEKNKKIITNLDEV